jgi:hypothetical protein
LKISFAKAGQNVANEFLAVASAYDEERGPIDDLNALYACNGYGVSHLYPPRNKVFAELKLLYPEVGKVSLGYKKYSLAMLTRIQDLWMGRQENDQIQHLPTSTLCWRPTRTLQCWFESVSFE